VGLIEEAEMRYARLLDDRREGEFHVGNTHTSPLSP
jgi:hypothetical protein